MSNQIQRIDSQESLPQVVSDSATLMTVISRAASDPSCDIEKMERLMAMHERMQASQASVAFNAAMAEMQCELPSIAERGKGHGTVRYATFEDINDVVKPIMQKHGFAVSFKVEHHQGGINVTGVLMHKAGHREDTTMLLPSDTSGSKNAVQAVGSSVSYGKRYVMSALLNLTTRGEDDDGLAAVPTASVTAVQAAAIKALLAQCSEKTVDWFIGEYGNAETVPKPEYDRLSARLNKAILAVKLAAEQGESNASNH